MCIQTHYYICICTYAYVSANYTQKSCFLSYKSFKVCYKVYCFQSFIVSPLHEKHEISFNKIKLFNIQLKILKLKYQNSVLFYNFSCEVSYSVIHSEVIHISVNSENWLMTKENIIAHFKWTVPSKRCEFITSD